ncbi:MAG: S8 family peptidase, partial [Solirubrobacteraceae bacterium]
GVSVGTLLARLRRDPRVRAARPEGRVQLRLTPNDPALTRSETAGGTPAGTPLQWSPGRAGLFHAWDLHRGAGALVGVIDTGADAGQPDLAGKIAAAVDQHADDDLPPISDPVGHGTHVSSLACAATGNGVGIAGAGHDCRLIVERSDLRDSSVVESVIDATNRGAHAINMSFGTDGRAILGMAEAVDYAVARRVVLVAAAADDAIADQGEPARLLQPTGTGPSLGAGKGLVVTASTLSDAPAGAGVGTQVSLAAPGSFLGFSNTAGPPGLFAGFPAAQTDLERFDLSNPLDPRPPCGCRTSLDGDNRWAYLQGTSMSSPQVAAVAALARRLNPDLSAVEIVRLLKESARRQGGWTAELGWGILDGGAALEAVSRVDRRAPWSRARAMPTTRARVVTVRWSGADPALAGLRASGIARFEVYRSYNGFPARRIAIRTRARSLRVRVFPGARYAFTTVAVDRAGNREARPARADATTRVLR